jgi:gliding motility-associated-like protein
MLTDNFCSNGLDASATVIVNPLPPAPFTGGDTTYCSNWEPIPLTASGSGGNLTWYADETLTTPISTIPSMEVGATTYYVSETLNGCQGSPSSVTITIENCNITVPTAFTPDGDNVNDSWEIIDLDYVYPENVVYVYNRWGGLIYQSDKGAYSIEPWKGDYKGNSLPVGSYYYVIELNDGKTDPLKGIISIIMND